MVVPILVRIVTETTPLRLNRTKLGRKVSCQHPFTQASSAAVMTSVELSVCLMLLLAIGGQMAFTVPRDDSPSGQELPHTPHLHDLLTPHSPASGSSYSHAYLAVRPEPRTRSPFVNDE